MKNKKRLLAVLMSTVVGASSMMPISANAYTPYVPHYIKHFNCLDEITTPEGYIQLEAAEAEKKYPPNFSGYFVFQSIDNPKDYIVYTDFSFNLTTLTVPRDKLEEWNTVYEQFFGDMDFTFNNLIAHEDEETVTVAFEDTIVDKETGHTENGFIHMTEVTLEDFASKEDVIRDACKKLFAAGYITDASYISLQLSDTWGQEINGVIQYAMSSSQKSFGEAKPLELLFRGDANGDDIIDLTDAACYLNYYAKASAGLAPQTEDFILDMNNDGEINIEEAAMVLNNYAEDAAGLA